METPRTETFLWYDLETFGRDTRRNRIAQFACLRTDANLEPVGEPESFLCAPAEDVLPSPLSCAVTGLTPQQCALKGLPEHEFAQAISARMSEPVTCVAGYNNIRFDDEFIRHLFYRNFHDPYAREYSNGNSRFDLLDVLRFAFALRPDGLEWPPRSEANGVPSFRLADLARANGIAHDAHDALGDVLATVALARELKLKQPKLWNYALQFRDKRWVRQFIEIGEPLFHVSGRYPAARGCAAIVLPLTELSNGEASILVFDLSEDPAPLLALPSTDPADLEAMREKLALLPHHALKRIRPNRMPMLAKLDRVKDDELKPLGIDRKVCAARAKQVMPLLGDLALRLRALFAPAPQAPADPELALYHGFIPDRDRSRFDAIRGAAPEQLRVFERMLSDLRLPPLLFRYRARNFPETLDHRERDAWERFRQARYHDPALSEVTAEQYFAELDELQRHGGVHAELVAALKDWARQLGLVLPQGAQASAAP